MIKELIAYVGGGSEDETPRDGVLSSRAEWHAVGLGVAVGFVTALSGGKDAAWLFIIFSGIAFGSKSVNVSHLKHLKKEPYYGLLGSIAAFLVTALIVIPRLPGGLS